MVYLKTFKNWQSNDRITFWIYKVWCLNTNHHDNIVFRLILLLCETESRVDKRPILLDLITFVVSPVQQQDFDMLLTNLRMDGVYTKENMNIHWVSERGVIENIIQIIQEFKATRGLLVSSIIIQASRFLQDLHIYVSRIH